MILLIDNYDSFVHNLARYFVRLGQPTTVVRNDAIDFDQLQKAPPQAIVISPGPGTPSDAGQSIDVVQRFHQHIPMLGVCLGHQVIVAALGGSVQRAPEPVHGRVSEITHDHRDLFEGLSSPMTVCRYHSLIASETNLPTALIITARTVDGIPMAFAHAQRPVFGVQFHPEAILTEHGYALLANFLRQAGLQTASPLPTVADELELTEPDDLPASTPPYTF